MPNVFRLQQDIEILKNITETPNVGLTRIGLSQTYRKAVNYIKQQMEMLGLEVKEDDIGNVYGILAGKNPNLPSIISGSHLDTVRNAGAYDGIAGVVCALEVARMIKEHNIQLQHNFEILATVEEEGTHFGTVLLGSRFIAGELVEKDRDRLCNDEGITLREILNDYSKNQSLIPVKRDPRTIKAFIELHDEQGPVLEATKTDIGIVNCIVAIGQFIVTFTGFAGHAGTVPMLLRQDAGIAGCSFINDLNEYVVRKYSELATLTIGKFELEPNSVNCIPNQCTFTLDIRSNHAEIICDIVEYARTLSELIEQKYAVSSDVKEVSFKDPVAMDKSLGYLFETVCSDLGFSYRKINSGAGHDAMIMAGICPSAMIFIPCHKGITHHPDEYVSGEDMQKGTKVLFETVIRLDK